MGYPGGSSGKESACNDGDWRSIPGLGRSPGEENDYLLQYSCLREKVFSLVQQIVCVVFLWLLLLHSRHGAEEINDPEMPMCRHTKSPNKACYLQTKDQDKEQSSKTENL